MAKNKIIAITLAAVLSGCAVQPEALTQDEMVSFADANLSALAADQEPISGPVSLYEAMARALKYNLDFRVERMKQALAMGDAELKSWEMLPSLVAKAGYSGRSNEPGGSSENLLTGVQSLAPSKSTEKETFTASLQFSWDILDFGLSYVRAQQAADKVLIAQERTRKVVNRIIEDVRTAFWRAASAQRLRQAMSRLRKRVRVALANARKQSRSQQTEPLAALTYERELVSIKRQLSELQRDLHTAKVQLALLMNVAPGTSFTLAVPRHRPTNLKIDHDPHQLISLALRNRPEMREQAYQLRINAKEADAAVLELLPGINLYSGLDWDSNKYLYNDHWVSWGAKATWNLFRVFRYPARRRVVQAREEVIKAQAQALAMAIIAQVHISRVRYLYQRHVFQAAHEYFDVQRRILNQVRAAVMNDVASEQSLIREQMNTVLAAVKYDVAYADLQNAIANVYASLGLDPYEGPVSTDMSVKELASALRRAWEKPLRLAQVNG